ncbi:MAG TPA: hypothetical protein VK166_13830 [Chitinophagaceae bacterium]|nr:hypothetical protein [Chitinophagaceae bacterium]
MKFLTGIFFLALCMQGLGQTSIDVDDTLMRNNTTFFNTVDGIPVLNPKYTRIVEGSLYEPANFTKAMVFIKNNKRAFTVEARIDVMDERLHYLDEKRQEKYADSPIEEVQFFEAEKNIGIFTSGIPGCGPAFKGWYEVLERGKMSLHRKIIKNVSEVKPYGSATTEQKVLTTYTYWLSNGSSCKQVKKISDLQAELVLANPAMQQKIPQRKLSDKKVDDWAELVKIYNAL